MITKICCDCKEQFEVEPAKAWATRCLPCWIAQQDRQGKKKVESLQAEVDYWRTRAQGGPANTSEIESLQRKNDRLEIEVARLKMELSFARNTTTKALPSDWRDYLPRLIQLCHPDKHGNSEAATKATVWLLAMKRCR
jgi:hypothetical protein